MIMISYVDKVTQFVYQNAFLPRQNSKTKRMISSKVKQRQFHLQYANDKHGESNSFMWNVCIIVTLMLLSSLLFIWGWKIFFLEYYVLRIIRDSFFTFLKYFV